MDVSISLQRQGTEWEALAVAVALENSRYYTLGCPKRIVATDHKPLLGILGDRALESIDNPRLVRIKQRTLPWNYELKHVPGKQQIASDGFYRRKQCAILAQIFTEEVNHNDFCEAAVALLKAGPSVITWEILKNNTSEDAVLAKVMEQQDKGFPDSSH